MSFTTPLPDSKINQTARNRLGEAIYLLAHIIRKADWKTGKLRTSRIRIAQETGFPEDTIKRWMQRLADVGEIICRQTLRGTEITIADYEAIARTRGVRKSGVKTDPMRVISDPDEPQKTHSMRVNNDPDHVLRILSQNKEKNSFLSSTSVHEELSDGVNDQPRCPAQHTEADYERQERIAREYMAGADEDTRQKLIDAALESMESDPRPFLRIFVRRDEQGKREFVSQSGDGPLMTRIGLLLETGPKCI